MAEWNDLKLATGVCVLDRKSVLVVAVDIVVAFISAHEVRVWAISDEIPGSITKGGVCLRAKICESM